MGPFQIVHHFTQGLPLTDDAPLAAVVTGEEDEETIHQVRGKLFSLGAHNAWTERGTCLLKLNVRKSDGGGASVRKISLRRMYIPLFSLFYTVMRKEAVYALLLNVTLFKGMHCSLDKDPRYVRFSAIEKGSTMHYNLRVCSFSSYATFNE